MGKRGPKSAAEKAVARLPNPAKIETVSRPDAPYDLTDEQSEEWWAVVNRLPADWFPRETHASLAQYCRHVVAARHIATLIARTESAKRIGIDRYDQLLKMQDREGRLMSSLATRMRLNQSSTMRQETTHKPDVVDSPWDYDGSKD